MNFRQLLYTILIPSSVFVGSHAIGQDQQQPDSIPGEWIRINQIGYYPEAPKLAAVTKNVAVDSFFICSAEEENPDTLYIGTLSEPYSSAYSTDTTRIADFSDFKMTGNYLLSVPGVGASFPIIIEPDIHHDLVIASLKAFYYQRASTSLPSRYAGQWRRAAGHPDSTVVIHPSASSPTHPEGSVISSPKGWYDAGDYNKYVVNSGITMGTLLAAYEDFPFFFDTLLTNIPESGDSIPDILNEILWNLEWMLTMQDADGGVYHKLTSASFEGMKVSPASAMKTRYVVQKSTAATLDFAAVMAQASRVYKAFDKQLPGLADTYLVAAQKAWQWAKKHPNQLYSQNDLNKKFMPRVTTGAYGDRQVNDEFLWAAAELYITTGDPVYQTSLAGYADMVMNIPSWSQVEMLGLYSLTREESKLDSATLTMIQPLKDSLIAYADQLTNGVGEQSYRTVMGKDSTDFVWGSNAVAANQGIALLQAYRISSDHKYVDFALSNLDYLLGRNATGYAYVTGFGVKSPWHPHHRLAVSDGIKAPVPGFLVGGPNPGQQDGCQYITHAADASYIDSSCSYASNEIAINWNAPLVYLVAAIESLQYEVRYSFKYN